MLLSPHQKVIFALELSRKQASGDPDRLEAAMLGAQVDLNPHQLDAALFALESPLSKGCILADEVGLGKPIEAGLALSQFISEGRKRALIVTPANLRKQWNVELREKFFITSEILEAKNYNSKLKQNKENPFESYHTIIISYQFAKNHDEEIAKIPWDLVIIDEAHRLKNFYRESNVISNAIKYSVKDRFKLFLTATPTSASHFGSFLKNDYS